MATRKILTVVDPTAAEQPAATRGLMLAAVLECELELLICDYDSRFAARRLFKDAEWQVLREQALQHQLGYLKSLRGQLAADGVRIGTRVVWDKPLAEAIVRAALREEPRIVLKDTHHHSVIARTLFSNTDWQLIRDCPAPLWLVKPGVLERPGVLAAVDPTNDHDKPAALDDAILDHAAALAGALDGEIHVYHGYNSLGEIAGAGALAMTPTPIAAKEINARVKADHETAFAALLRDRGLAISRQHLLAGAPAEVLPALARRIGAGLVVMGAVSRGRLERAAVGSTAERVLDQLPCDVLVIKPPGFDSDTIYKAQAADFMELSD